jgi:hypothetical protein
MCVFERFFTAMVEPAGWTQQHISGCKDMVVFSPVVEGNIMGELPHGSAATVLCEQQ